MPKIAPTKIIPITEHKFKNAEFLSKFKNKKPNIPANITIKVVKNCFIKSSFIFKYYIFSNFYYYLGVSIIFNYEI
ncbi:hypothetical protein CSF_0186 [Campylobacter sputorum bv. faecalis CCUG 20703]|nr:hypothetical protein CSF_0186 [Campylobacter sputorum bv. faecalis CCUG 20703]